MVDDGSSDGTAAVAGGFPGVRVLRQPKNGGKSAAVFAGLHATRAGRILLLDADLLGLDAGAVTALIAPVTAGESDVAISLRCNAPGLWRRIGLDYISGERVVPRAHLERIAGQPMARFGIEVAMNRVWLAEAARIKVVRWPGVDSPVKAAKRGVWRGIAADLRMLADLCATVPPHRLAGQIIALRRARV